MWLSSTDRQTDRQADRQTDRQTDIHPPIHPFIHPSIHAYAHIVRIHISKDAVIDLLSERRRKAHGTFKGVRVNG